VRLAVVLLSFVLVACGVGETAPPAEPRDGPEPVSVSIIRVDRESVVRTIVGTGTLAAHKTTDVGPRVTGIIEEILVRVGDRVEAGAPLFRTRSSDYEIRVRQASAQARLARAEAERMERELRRIEKLHADGVASEGGLDEARTAFETAAARRDAAAAALAEAEQNLSDTEVPAPYAGVITHRYVDEGAMMSTMMSATSKVVQIMKIDFVAAIVQVPEVYLSQIQVGTPGRVTVDGVPGVFESQVHVLNDRVDHRSRAVEVRLGIPNPDYVLKPGLFVRVELIPEPREVLTVPRESVLGPPGARYVFVEEGGVARRRPVTVRELDTRRMEVVEGLLPGDPVIGGPRLSLVSDGAPVEPEVPLADR